MHRNWNKATLHRRNKTKIAAIALVAACLAVAYVGADPPDPTSPPPERPIALHTP